MKYTLWGVFQYSQIWDEGVVRPLLVLMSIGICILCRFYKEHLAAVCYCATTLPQDQGYKRIISCSSLTLSLVINGKQSRINFNWSVRFLNNWHSLQSLNKITAGVWGLAFSSSFFQVCVAAAVMQEIPPGYAAQLPPQHIPVLQMKLRQVGAVWYSTRVCFRSALLSAEQWSASPSDAVGFVPLNCLYYF